MKKKIIYTMILVFGIIVLKSAKVMAAEIPKVYFEGDISNMTTKQDEREIKLKYTSEQINFERSTKIKIQGSSSLAYEKKNYTINLYEDDTYSDKSKVDVGYGWGAQSKYCLKANWIDKTHARNIVSARIAGEAQRKYNVLSGLPNNGSIDGFPIEVYINNEFLGLYTWNIAKDEWMWNIDKNNPNHIVLGGDEYTDSVNFKTEITSFEESDWDVEVGTTNQETVDNFNKLVRFINNSTEKQFEKNFDLYLNRDACLNYIVMIYMIEGIDNTGRNMMLATYDNGQTWYPCLYDLDSTFGTNWVGDKIDYKILQEEVFANHSDNNLIKKMVKSMADEISNRYFELRKDILSKENLMNEFNSFIESVTETTYKKEAERWGENIPGYGIEQIEEYLDERIPYLDNLMYDRYTIKPSVTVEYSTTNLTNHDVVATVNSNRSDIVILKDGEVTYDYTYTFTENGTYTFEYQDWNGKNQKTITAEVNWIDKNITEDTALEELSQKEESESTVKIILIITIDIIILTMIVIITKRIIQKNKKMKYIKYFSKF